MPRPLTDADRARAPGSFAELSSGFCHYRLEGPDDDGAPVVVCVHGFASPSFSWDHTVPAFHAAGMRTLRFDLFGRGWSDRPRVPYTIELFDRQIFDLLRALRIRGPIALLGWSMGGLVSATFAQRHPELVSALAMIAPAGLPVATPPITRLMKLPVIGEALLLPFGLRVMRNGIGKMFDNDPHDLQGWFESEFDVQTQFRGYRRALLSTLRHTPLDDISGTYAVLGRRPNLPVLLVWGEQDHICPHDNHERMLQLIPRARFMGFPGAGHAVHLEAREAVNAAFVEFFSDAISAR